MPIEKFELPRKDWYDEEGRIYKDALIENFNAIENRLIGFQEMSALVPVEIIWDDLDIPDVTLDDPNTKIVNLKSLIAILGLDKMPASINVNGKKIVRLVYYHDNQRHIITDKELTIENNQFVWLTPSTGEISVVSNSVVETNITNKVEGYPVAFFANGSLNTVRNPVVLDYDMLTPLSRMKVTPVTFTNDLGKNTQHKDRDRFSGRRVGYTWINKRAGSMLNLTMPDVGYEGDGQRN